MCIFRIRASLVRSESGECVCILNWASARIVQQIGWSIQILNGFLEFYQLSCKIARESDQRYPNLYPTDENFFPNNEKRVLTCVSDKFNACANAFRSAPTTYWLLSNACSNFNNWPGEKAVRTRFGFLNGCNKKSVKE